MKTASIVILERGNRWGGLLRRELQPVIAASDSRKVRWQIREVRALAQAEDLLQENPYAMLMIEVRPANLTMAYAEGVDLQQRFGNAKFLALAENSLSWAIPFLREAWASDVFTSSMDLVRWTPMVKRYVRSLPQAELSWEEQLDQLLPWPAYRT